MQAIGVAKVVMVCIANLVLFGLAVSPATWVNEPAKSAAILVVAYCVAGAVSRFWSRGLLLAVLPAMVAVTVCLGLLKWAMHLADTGGEFAYPVWEQITSASTPEILVLFGASISAALGWLASDKALRARTRTAE